MFNLDFTFTSTNMKFSSCHMLIEDVKNKNELRQQNTNPRKVCIYGAGSVLVPLFLPLLLRTPGLATCNGLRVGLYDEEISKKELLKDINKEFDCVIPDDFCNVYFTSYIVNNILQAAKDCDLFILIIPQFHLLHDAKDVCWSQSISYAERAGRYLSHKSRENTRIILVSESGKTPICLCAAAFNQAASPNISQNVVAITAEIGLVMRSVLAQSLEVTVDQIKEIPVWGFVGVSHLLDPSLVLADDEIVSESELLQKLQSDPIHRENFLLSHLWPLFERRQISKEVLLQRKPHWPTVEALMDTLHKWYSEDSCEKITFLGIISDGTFGIPPGIFFSQPAILTGGCWRPYGVHSLPRDQFCTIDNLCSTAILLSNTYLNKNMCRYGLMGLEVEMNYEYFLNGEKLQDKSLSNIFTENEHAEDIEKSRFQQSCYYIEDIVTDFIKKSTKTIFTGTQHEDILPSQFHDKETYYLISTLMKEMMHNILQEIEMACLIPCLFVADSDIEFVILLVKDSITKILTEMQFELLVDCIIPQDDKESDLSP